MTADASIRGRVAAHSRWAHETDRRAATAPARAAGPTSLTYFERQVDPDGLLSVAERATRAEHARSAYFLRLARKSAEARRKT